jgi:hypothetical protein
MWKNTLQKSYLNRLMAKIEKNKYLTTATKVEARLRRNGTPAIGVNVRLLWDPNYTNAKQAGSIHAHHYSLGFSKNILQQ